MLSKLIQDPETTQEPEVLNEPSSENITNYFYSLLNTTENDIEYDDTGKCLITHEPLTSTAVHMECGHQFNYYPLYCYLVNFKTKFNNYEKKYVSSNKIICPYCRNIQSSLLPYIEMPNVYKIHGVNMIFYHNKHIGTCFNKGCKSSVVYTYYDGKHEFCFYHCCAQIRKENKQLDKNKNKTITKTKTKRKPKPTEQNSEINAEPKQYCNYVYVRGQKAGKKCGTLVLANKEECLCSKHTQKKSNINQVLSVAPPSNATVMPFI